MIDGSKSKQKCTAGYARGLDAGMAWGSAHGGLLMLDELRNKELITNEIQVGAWAGLSHASTKGRSLSIE